MDSAGGAEAPKAPPPKSATVVKIVITWSISSDENNNIGLVYTHTGQCKSTGGCYNELVVAYFGTGGK